MKKTIGVVLAGGNSTRFGEDKAFFKLEGKPMYRHVVDTIWTSGVVDEVIISTNQRLAECFEDMDTIVDGNFQDCGPLGGLHEVSRAFPEDCLLVVSCDTPHVSPEWLRILGSRAAAYPDALIVTKAQDRLHPLIGIYQGSGLSDTLRHLIDRGRLSMRGLFEERQTIEVDAAFYDIDEKIFTNINRKTDIRLRGYESGEHYR
ncbi:molybdenum cofactor guanylyltransferase [Salinicoccus sesuvii]|uniref:Probable molybdenum cofactor guanylyltransferase n=1 Tax=Salinicoccus sesuvii TaxID=868281 RepID=A0ABV7NA84_9STAP